jgi:hypothetical protein
MIAKSVLTTAPWLAAANPVKVATTDDLILILVDKRIISKDKVFDRFCQVVDSFQDLLTPKNLLLAGGL